MTDIARHPGRRHWALVFLSAVLTVALGLFTAAPASAATTPTAQNVVGASNSAGQVAVEPAAGIAAGQRLRSDPPQPQIVVATGVAVNTADDLVNLASPSRTTHILQGDATGGGAPMAGPAGQDAVPSDVVC